MTRLGLIWAQAGSGVIGRDGAIPWQLPEDQAHFRRITMGSVVVMGRRTWESLPAKVRPLPGRSNIVLTRQAHYRADGAAVAATLDGVRTGGDVWVIGGEQVYALALPLATRCEVTEIDVDLPVADSDVLAPLLDDTWERSAGEWLTSARGLRYRFLSYRRAAAAAAG